MSGGAAAIVGAAETEIVGKIPGTSAIELAAQSARRALADCGLSIKDVDGIAAAELPPINVAHYLGVSPTWIDSTSIGGCSFLVHVRHAVAAIMAGMAEVVLVVHGESGRSGVGQPPWAVNPAGLDGQFETPFGVWGPPACMTIPAMRYMHEVGLTHEQLASVAVSQRKWAALNPRAYMRDPITIEDVLKSRLIAYPFHLLECCLVTDGGGALVVTSAERAADLPTRPVYILGTGEASDAPVVAQMEDMTYSKAFRVSSSRAFAEARLTPADIDHVMIYDAFAHLPVFGLEDCGFLKRGEAGAFIAEGRTEPGRDLPVNTNGGGLSYTHTGMYGMFAIQESVRQLRGEAAAQVEGVRTSFVQGVGGNFFMSGGSLVLSNERTAS